MADAFRTSCPASAGDHPDRSRGVHGWMRAAVKRGYFRMKSPLQNNRHEKLYNEHSNRQVGIRLTRAITQLRRCRGEKGLWLITLPSPLPSREGVVYLINRQTRLII
jgi:hypothetical protein